MDGEDIFIDNFFKNKIGLYVDVGAYHPLELSNTYLLHKRKWEGINIDINSLSIEYFDFLRPKFRCSKKKFYKNNIFSKKQISTEYIEFESRKKNFFQ